MWPGEEATFNNTYKTNVSACVILSLSWFLIASREAKFKALKKALENVPQLAPGPII